MPAKIADISNYQYHEGQMVNYVKSLHDELNVKGVCTLISQGTNWINPYARNQVSAVYSVFKRFSCYHFFTGGGRAEGFQFLKALKYIGADYTTVLMIDAETATPNLTASINGCIDVLWEHGFRHIYVYSMGSMFNYSSTGIQIGSLHHKPKIWIASIGTTLRPIGADVWQYTWTGSNFGKAVDLDYDYVGDLSKGVEPDKPRYQKSGKLFEVRSLLHVYKDKGFKLCRRPQLAKGSRIYAKPVKYGHIYRLLTKIGYISANTQLVKKIK